MSEMNRFDTLRFNEDTRVKFPASVHFLRLGYEYQPLRKGEIDFETKVFINRFKPSLSRINSKDYTDSEIASILSDIAVAIKANDLGRTFYNWLINPQDRPKLIDFDNIENNDFSIVDELPFSPKEKTEEGSFRPDINVLINGIPLAFLEVKKPNNEGGIQKEFNRMINQRLVNDDFKKFFNLLQIVSFSNNMEYEDDDSSDAEDVKVGSFYTTPNGTNTTFSFFREDDKEHITNHVYKEVTREQIEEILREENYDVSEIDSPEFQTNLDPFSPCNKFITSIFDHERLLYFLRYGIMYLTENKKRVDQLTNKVEEIPVPQKHIMRYPQFFATRRIVDRLDNGGRGGIIWHTQGSGKTALAAFSVRILRDYYSKKGVTAKVFFIVDRLDLSRQASDEFAMRNLSVVNCQTKDELGKELAKTTSTPKNDAIGEICVVNIQRIDPERMPQVKNDYDVKVQRIFFIDEAHRSYAKSTGEFYKNLMTCDTDGVYIAMTGTPLLTKSQRSNLRFGDYIHKYFYDKSIADGYTLRIKKEEIETVAKEEIRANLDIEKQNIDQDDVYESNDFVNCVSKYIEKDFKFFRLENTDNTIGGMIVCRSNQQAKLIHNWFEENSSLKTGLVLSDAGNPAQDAINKTNQEDFKKNGTPDMLVVHFMLTTGYDVSRLKKMYLLRAPKAHSLLQTISRVNRPYKNRETGKTYKYGYIVDFVDIEEEYNNSLQAYIKELEEDSNIDGDDNYTLVGLVIDKEDIQKKFLTFKEELSKLPVKTDNLEEFSQSLAYLNKDALLKIRKVLNGIKECRIEFELSRAEEYAKQIDKDKLSKLLNTLKLRINLLNLQTRTLDTLSILNNKEVMEVLYEFFKVKTYILNLSDFDASSEEVTELQKIIEKLQTEISRNRNRNDIRVRNLEELLKEVFERMSIDNIAELTGEIKKAVEEAKAINEENERLAETYGGHYSFVKTYTEAVLKYNVDRSDLEQLLIAVYGYLQDKMKGDTITIQGKSNFVKAIQKEITPALFMAGLYGKVKNDLSDIIGDLYTNIQLFM
ncbi:MAG: type I restriction endonuclease subunit R [Erysipelotrichaceae bacterium]|nr:type I restriction endonuclease subunit R [Erysipelotrichaceae bacterium]